ncbi:MAG: aminoglycoside phosphotransferase family protein [Saprospiraceae bacterium]
MEHIVSHFLDFEKLVSFLPFGGGHINDTFKVAINEGGQHKNYLLQRINHQVFQQPEQVMENIFLVAEHLSNQAYPLNILSPIHSKNGGWLFKGTEGNFWRLFPFFENTVSFHSVESVEQAFGAARAFGIFAKALNGMDASKLLVTIPGFHDGLARLAHFKKVLKNARQERLREANSEIQILLDNQLVFKKIASLGLPLRAVHHDAKINNLLFDKTTLKPVAVVDLDTVMPGIVLSDFGDMVRTFTCPADEDEADLSKVEMRVPFFEAVLEGFLSETGSLLTPAERENLAAGGRWLTLMQAMRFLGDYLTGDVYYKTKYPRHNLVRARNQLALFRSMG